MILHLIRHGETASNRRTYAGRVDVDLTDVGCAQALAIVDQLKERPIGTIFTSPLSRSMETARPLTEHLGVAPLVLPALMEFDFGDYEGRPKDHLGLKLRKQHAVRPVPGGESLWNLWQRAAIVSENLANANISFGSEVAIFGHHWINRMIFGRLSRMTFEEACKSRSYRPETGSVIEIDFDLEATTS